MRPIHDPAPQRIPPVELSPEGLQMPHLCDFEQLRPSAGSFESFPRLPAQNPEKQVTRDLMIVE